MGRRSFHQLYDWYRSYIDSCPDASDLLFFVVRDKGEPVAICPLRARKSWFLGLRLTVLDQPYLDLNCDFVYEKSPTNAGLLAHLLPALRIMCPHDVLWLEGVPEDSSLMYSVWSSQQTFTIAEVQESSAHIPCDQPYEHVLNLTSGKFRRNLRVAQQRASSRGGVRITSTSSPHDLPEAMSKFLEVEASGWKGLAGARTAVKLDEECQSLYESAMRHFGSQGRCVINLLWAEGHCIAGQFCLVVDDTLSVLKIGYDERYRRLSPGHVLFSDTLKRCCSAPEIGFINLISDPFWMRHWNLSRSNTYRLFIFNRRPLSLSAWSILRIRVAASRALKRLRLGQG